MEKFRKNFGSAIEFWLPLERLTARPAHVARDDGAWPTEAGFVIRKVYFKSHYEAIPRSLGKVPKFLASAFLKPFARGVAGGQVIIVFAEKVRSLDAPAHATG